MLLRVESSSKALISFSFALHMYLFDLVLYVCMKHCDNYFYLQVVGVPWPVALWCSHLSSGAVWTDTQL